MTKIEVFLAFLASSTILKLQWFLSFIVTNIAVIFVYCRAQIIQLRFKVTFNA